MRYRATFLAGLAVGFVAGTRAGRERYEQMKKLARKAVESPAVRKTTQAAGVKATELTKAPGTRPPRGCLSSPRRPRTAPARCAGSSTGYPAATPGPPADESEHATVNGIRPGD